MSMGQTTVSRDRQRWGDPPKIAPAGLLDSVEWAFQSGPFTALGHRFGIRTTDPDLGAYLETTLRPLSAPGAVNTFYSLLDCGPQDRPYLLYFGDELIMHCEGPSTQMISLTGDINRRAIASGQDFVLVHAAVAERDGVGLLLPGGMEAGKTTLVAGLVASGFRYLSDEAAAIDPLTLAVTAFPKPLSIDTGSWEVLSFLEPKVDEGVRKYLKRQWLLSAEEMRSDAVIATTTPRVMIFPRYVDGAETRLEETERPSLLMDLAPLTFEFRREPHRNLAVLAALLDRCVCYRLTVGDLRTACDLVLRVVDEAAGAGADKPGRRTDGDIDGRFVALKRPAPVSTVDGEVIVYLPETEALHRLNGTAALIWSELDGVRTLSEIAAGLATASSADPDHVERDVIEFVRRLASAGLAEKSG